jgi:hypothetical protein
MILCCQGLFFVAGFGGILLGPTRLGGRIISEGRLLLMGGLLIAHWPFSFIIADWVLGSVPPGPIDGAPMQEGFTRWAALMTEWLILSGVGLAVAILWFLAPRAPQTPPTV